MTFEEFKELALNPPYIEQETVYRVDVHCYVKSSKEREAHETQFEVRRNHSFVFSDLSSAQSKLKQIISDEELKDTLYAIYIYQLPMGKDISSDLYQRLWVYDRSGKLNGQSRCTAIIEDLDHTSAKFRGHEAESIRFNPGDIVEIYDRGHDMVRLATVIDRPMSIEQCWKEREFVVLSCLVEGLGTEATEDNYWLYAVSDCYEVINDTGYENNRLNPCSYDIFAPSLPISPEIRHRFDDYYRVVMKSIDNINKNRQRIVDNFNRLVDLL